MAGKTFVVKNTTVEEHEKDYKPLLEINHQINSDVANAMLYKNAATDVSISTTTIGPMGFLASHKAPGTVCIQVLNGSGKTGLIDESGKTYCEINLSAEDMLIFEQGMPFHYYNAGKDGISYVAISFPAV